MTSTVHAPASAVAPTTTVSHLIIFNPDLKPAPKSKSDDEHEGVAAAGQPQDNVQEQEQELLGQAEEGSRDKDLEDDIKEASQIVFYTSRAAQGGRVSRDTMLRQFGLAKGMMGFTDMVLGPDASSNQQGWWGVHSHKSRMIIMRLEPESQHAFYIYINIALGTGAGAISDHMIVNALQRGHDDFRLLYGPLSALMPPSPSSSATIDRFWTKFAHSFESIYLSPRHREGVLAAWLDGWPVPSLPTPALAVGDKEVLGLIGRSGPITPVPAGVGVNMAALVRFLVHQLHLALPPLPSALPPPHPTSTPGRDTGIERSALGLGFGFGTNRKKVTAANGESRTSSWTSWVGLGTGSNTPTSSSTKAKSAEREREADQAGSRWPSFGLAGVGTVFGLGPSKATDSTSTPAPAQPDLSTATTSKPSSLTDGQESQPQEHHSQQVEQTAVALPDLEEAVRPQEEVLSWDSKDIWLVIPEKGSEGREGAQYAQRRVSWIIRDEVLLYVLHDHDHDLSSSGSCLPDTAATLKVFASLSSSQPPRSSTSIDSAPGPGPTRPSTPTSASTNGYIYHDSSQGVTDRQDQDQIDQSSMRTLAELKDTLTSHGEIHEIHAKTAQGKFLLAKHAPLPGHGALPENEAGAKGRGAEVYIQVGRKDATLTDAEYALRSINRLHPDIPV